MRILVAEADPPLADSFRQLLARDEFSVQVVSSGDEAQFLAVNEPYDLLVVDLALPEHASLEFLRGIKAEKPELAILAMSGASCVEERVRALDAGADDCLSKPFAFAELAARIRAVLRRGSRPAGAVLTVGDLALDRVSHTVQRCGRAVELSPREFALLEFLMRHAGQPVTRNAIVENVWKTSFETATNVVDVYINYLRRKVDSGFDQALIHTVRGVGYQINGNNGRA
jgi:DNA-binding response OmpR family regulator